MNFVFRALLLGCSTLLGVLLGSLGPAAAADLGRETPGVAGPPHQWSIRFTSYSWSAWLTGDVSVAGRKFDVKVDPIEIIDHLDWSTLPVWMSYAEARNGRLMLFNDIVYSKIEGSGDFARSKQGRFAALALAGDIEADYTQATVELGAGYEIWSQGNTALDALAGARYWYQETTVSGDLNATLAIGGPLGLGGLRISRGRVFAGSGTIDWFDPFVGARLRHTLGPGQELMLRGDVGGFGAGSEFSWQVLATANWQICVTDRYAIDAYVGYRALSVDYSQGSGLREYEYDVLQHGPVVGLTTRF